MHAGHDQFIGRIFLEHVGDESQLPLVETTFEFAAAARLSRIEAEIVDIIEHQEQRAAIFECVIVRAVGPLECLARIFRAWSFVIQIVIAADVVPRQSDLADDAVQARIKRQIVEHDVAGGHAECRLGADQGVDHIIADEIDFDLALRLRIGEDNDVKFLRLVDRAQREIERIRQRSGRIDAAISQIEILRRARRLMNVIKSRQHVRIDRHGIAGRFDNEDDVPVLEWKRVASVRVGLDDIAAVRDQNAGNTRIACLTMNTAGAIFVNDARDGAAVRRKGSAERNNRSGERCGGSIFHDVAARGLKLAARETFAQSSHG